MVCFKEEKEESISCEKKGKIKKQKAIFERGKTTHRLFHSFSTKRRLNNKEEEDKKKKRLVLPHKKRP